MLSAFTIFEIILLCVLYKTVIVNTLLMVLQSIKLLHVKFIIRSFNLKISHKKVKPSFKESRSHWHSLNDCIQTSLYVRLQHMCETQKQSSCSSLILYRRSSDVMVPCIKGMGSIKEAPSCPSAFCHVRMLRCHYEAQTLHLARL